MTTRQALTLLLMLATFSVAHAQAKFLEKTGGHCFQMQVPNYMLKTYELNDVASLQYLNTAKEAYVVVIDDSKEELESKGIKFTDAEDFLADFATDYKKEAKKRKMSKVSTATVNGNAVADVELTWKDEDGNFYMLITAVETKTHFYKILCWTTEANVKLLKEDYKTMARSIRD
ncbi:hypothetical protein [Pontibacter beigongshangensis]|uniref:hypothetical protein n=1 Tax=Pontibacter beigongshangensis TaxID=2574733 RepID=UPI001F50F4FA|nr:hypothetical protein [Pontibacter beigongshangensis]